MPTPSPRWLPLVLSLAACGAPPRGGVPEVAQPRAAPAEAALPSAKEIVARYAVALGGRVAILRHTSATMRGTMEIHRPSGKLSLPFVFLAAAPYRRIERLSLPDGRGEVLNGFDGETAWSLDPRSGPRLIVGDEHQSVKRNADFYYALDELTWFKSMDTVGVEDYEGRRCFRLHGINQWDKSNDHFYDVETGLLDGYELESERGLVHEIFSDYRRVDGVLVPTLQTVKTRPKTGGEWTVVQTLAYASITFDDVPPAAFTPPEAVRDLIAKAGAKGKDVAL
jgi:hypothetical protein